jgi:hypothetical protein
MTFRYAQPFLQRKKQASQKKEVARNEHSGLSQKHHYHCFGRRGISKN